DTMENLFPKSSETKQRFLIKFCELQPEIIADITPLRVRPLPVIHFSGSPAYALRIECDDVIIAYSGDTEWTNNLLRVASGADLFICESYFPGKKIRFHLDYETLAAHKAELGCK